MAVMQFEWEEFLGEFDVSWEARGNEWISRIVEHMAEHHGITGHQMAAYGSFMKVTVSVGGEGGNSDTCLIVFPLPEKKVVVLACGTERADEELVSGFRGRT